MERAGLHDGAEVIRGRTLAQCRMDVFCDPVLIRELAEPGSDGRHGVNFVARPPREIIREIARIHAVLRRVEPSQYYYPLPDLHLTVFEISHGLKSEEAAFVAENAG